VQAATEVARAFVTFDVLFHNVEISRAQQAVEAGRVVTDADGKPLAALHESAWLFMIDDAPGAFWSHSARMLLLGMESGSVCVVPTESWPLLDGAMPLFDDDSEVVLTFLEVPAMGQVALATPVPPLPEPSIEDMLTYTLVDDVLVCPDELFEEPPCVDGEGELYLCADPPPKRYAMLLYGPPREVGKWEAKYDAEDIANAMKTLQPQLIRYNFEVYGPYNISLEEHRSKLQKLIARLSRVLKCQDEVFVYYHGHGQHLPDEGTYRIGGKNGLTAEALRDLLQPLPTCHLHVMIDACHAGGFIPVLQTLPAVETMFTSAAADELAWVSIVDEMPHKKTGETIKDPNQGGEKGGEFSSGVMHFLVTSYDKRDLPVKTLLQQAASFAEQNDVAALAEVSHPQRYIRTKKCVCDESGARFVGLLHCPDDTYITIFDDVPVTIFHDRVFMDTIGSETTQNVSRGSGLTVTRPSAAGMMPTTAGF
jgi:hypothetical protein